MGDNGTKVPGEMRSRGIDAVMAIPWQRTNEGWFVPDAKKRPRDKSSLAYVAAPADILFVPPNMVGGQRRRSSVRSAEYLGYG
jgi:hypothetical protein